MDDINNKKLILENLKDIFVYLKDDSEILFRDIIEINIGKKILKFNDKILVGKINNLAEKFINYFNNNSEKLIYEYEKSGKKLPSRINEFGNMIEEMFASFVENDNYLKKLTFSQKTGYPDLIFSTKDQKIIYFEIKTFNQGNDKSSFRTFYYSFGNKQKIKHDGFHVLIAFETSRKKRKISNYDFQFPESITSCKVKDLYDLEVNVKIEFNAGNNKLY